MKRAALFALLLSAAAAAAIDWREVASVRVPEGEAASVAVDGETVWKRLPYDAEIEYLESNGMQYVNTGVPTVTPFVVEVKFSISPDGKTNDSLFGTFLSNNRLWLLLTKLANGKNRISIRCTNPQTSAGANVVDLLDNQVATIKARFGASGWFELNGGSRVTYPSTDVSLPNNNLYLLGRNGNNFPIGARLYRVSISDVDGALTRDFTPVRVGLTGYLYDRVSGQLFGNMGTGAFVLGPDKE